MPSCLLSVRVQPRASRDEIVGRQGDEIKVRITAPPVEGAANKHLIKFLAKKLGVKKARLQIRSGQTGRSKIVEIEGITLAEAEAALGLKE